ncbi:helix-turn-helix domain-containing protein [Streptomyces avicenniae]|uniref:helix-turn-helix domain-containing protein n=1 Tax=Streptomyces avicenniae TaxID=500153 RepID=UPI00069A115C|nr:helix-turn-helix transcriptional regulator [Streptomyces avicenniae]
MDEALRRELGAHLRAAREQVTPEDVGLGRGPRRRAPGLRREEVAALAGVSVAWYTWLEQGRVRTTRQVIDALCRTLRMDDDARRHALALAGFLPGAPLAPGEHARPGPGTRALLAGWDGTPALALDERLDVLASNAAHRALWGDPEHLPAERRNLLLHLAAGPPGPRRIADPEPLLRGLYQHFRTATAHVPDDPRAAEIVRLLHRERPDAAHWWDCRTVAEFRPVTVTAGPERLTFTLLRPVGDPGVLLLTQTPAGA